MRTIAAVALAVIGLSLPLNLTAQAQPKPVSRILDIATGVSRDIGINGLSTRAPRWSPDGKRIAVQVSRGDVTLISFYSGDLSGRTTICSLAADLINAQSAWSPSGKRLAVRTPTELWTLDTQTCASKKLGPEMHPHHLIWATDDTIIVARIPIMQQPYHVEVFASAYNGEERLLTDVNALRPDENPLGYFASPDEFVLMNPARVLIDRKGGETVLPGDGPRSGAPGVAGNGDWLLFGVGAADAPVHQLELIDVKNRKATTFDLDFDARTVAFSRPALAPDHSWAIVLGRKHPSDAWAFYKVSFSGDGIHLLATLDCDPSSYHFDLSPDAKHLAYSCEPPTTR